MSAVGFDLYSQMLREAVAEARGEPPIAHADIKVALPAKTYLPEEYVPEVDQRVLFYRRIAGAPTIEAIERVETELRERFGPMPEPARDLVAVARIRTIAAEAGLTDVSVVRRRILVGPISPDDGIRSAAAKIGAIYLDRERKFALAADAGGSPLETAKSLLDAILTGTERT
jgi:transcription-repair coupling factor (superfamily II helicase)